MTPLTGGVPHCVHNGSTINDLGRGPEEIEKRKDVEQFLLKSAYELN